jgi:hypothetical protein
VQSENLKVRFTYGDLSQEVHAKYDAESDSIYCKTPKFEEFDDAHPSLQLPCKCFLSVTLDGINYSECEQPFTIYSNEIQISSVNPKCGSVTGGTEITLMINIDAETASSLCDLKVGFQPKKSAKKNEMSRQSIE